MIYCLDARTVTDHFPGIGRYTLNLARAMSTGLAADEQLVLLRDPRSSSPWELTDLDAPRVRIVDVPVSPFSLRQQWMVPATVRRLQVDLYHSPYYLMPYIPGVPTLVTIHDLIPLVYPQYFSRSRRLLFAGTVRLALRASSRIIAVSQATANDLIRHLNVTRQMVHVIAEAADPIFIQPERSKIDRVRKRYDLPIDYLLYFGSNKPHKNLIRLIRAWTDLQPQPMPLVVAGAWDDRYPDAKQIASERRDGAGVRFLGRLPDADLPALYAGAVLFVFPSEYEGFGLPILEAMACGTPVACADSPALREVAGDAAHLFDPTDIAAIKQALQVMLHDADQRDRLRTRGLERSASFSWTRAAGDTLALYREILT